tara:strand:- start:2542 stop:2760 length:219 start_codon:yes stop_codon:yes gene_type:complete
MKQLAAQALAYQYKLQIDNAKTIINNDNAGLEFIDQALRDTIFATEKLKLLNTMVEESLKKVEKASESDKKS